MSCSHDKVVTTMTLLFQCTGDPFVVYWIVASCCCEGYRALGSMNIGLVPGSKEIGSPGKKDEMECKRWDVLNFCFLRDEGGFTCIHYEWVIDYKHLLKMKLSEDKMLYYGLKGNQHCTEYRSWTSNYMCINLWDVLAYPCPNFEDHFAESF